MLLQECGPWWWSENLVSSYGNLEDALLALSMAYYCYRLKSVVLHDTNNGNAVNFIENQLLHPSSKEELSFYHIRLCSADHSKLDSCFGDDQCIVWAMNKDETVHELSYYIIKTIFQHFIARNRYHFVVHTFAGQQINKMSVEVQLQIL